MEEMNDQSNFLFWLKLFSNLTLLKKVISRHFTIILLYALNF